MRIPSLLFFVMLCVLAAPGALADTLLLRSGDQIIGSIAGETPDEYIVDIPGEVVIQIRVRRADVIQVVRSGDVYPSATPSSATPEAASAAIDASTSTTSIYPTIPTLPPDSLQPVGDSIQTGGFTTPVTAPAQAQAPDPDAALPLLPLALPQNNLYQVSGAGVRFREGPNLTFPIVDTLPGRTLLIEIETVDGWIHAKTTEGVTGWIHPNFVTPLPRQLFAITGDLVNVREAPGEVYRSLGRLRKNDVVIQLEERPGWRRILSGDSLAGWVSEEFLQPLDPQQAQNPRMVVIQNRDAGSPVAVKRPMNASSPEVTFSVLDERLVIGGTTKLIVFFNNPNQLAQASEAYGGPSIIQRTHLASSVEMMNRGFPEELAVNFIGGEILTLLGERAAQGWDFNLLAPNDPGVRYGFMVQRGPSRGTLILVEPPAAAQ